MSVNKYDPVTGQLIPVTGTNSEVMTGATSQSDGEAGLVPAPSIADKDKCLRGDGSWGNVSSAFFGTMAQWNALTTAQKAEYEEVNLTDDYYDEAPFTGATANDNGTPGLVPRPLIANRNGFLQGNGQWTDIPTGDVADLNTTVKTDLVAAVNEVKSQADKCECLVVSTNSVSALPVDISNANIETDMVVVQSVLSNPSAQLSDWNWTTDTAGKVTISGTISGSTNITLYLIKSR